MAELINNARVATATTGTGTVTLSASTLVPWQTWAAAGAVNGLTYSYRIDDGAAWEIGTGVYSSAGPTLTRNMQASSTGSLLSLSGSATVANVERAEDLLPGGASASFVTSEALVVGLVNLWSNAGAFHARKADQSLGQEASGFVRSAFGSGATATVYFYGLVNGLSGLTPGKLFLANAGLVSNTVGATWMQEVGWGVSASSLMFMPKPGVQL